MPSREQMALRKSAAQERLNGTVAALSERLGIDAATIGETPGKDPELAAVVQVEEIADALDAIAAALPEKAAPKAAPKKDA